MSNSKLGESESKALKLGQEVDRLTYLLKENSY